MATKKAPKKKAPAKKAAKKAPARKAVKKAAPARKKATHPIAAKLTKGQVVGAISEAVGLTKRQVAEVMEELHSLIERSIKKRGSGEFTIPGILKITTRVKPAQKASVRPSPFNPGQMMQVKAKPASIQVKIRPLKKLKETAQKS